MVRGHGYWIACVRVNVLMREARGRRLRGGEEIEVKCTKGVVDITLFHRTTSFQAPSFFGVFMYSTNFKSLTSL